MGTVEGKAGNKSEEVGERGRGGGGGVWEDGNEFPGEGGKQKRL